MNDIRDYCPDCGYYDVDEYGWCYRCGEYTLEPHIRTNIRGWI